ncbi:MAG: Hg(II)-responsive transcriptional regulator [Nevskiaceae bacterium]|jgi:MerR family transcriptional regulator, mercuric resistance operon regulatory protein|nr:MAG: Hg(II)-responsive transcriptional regulator [Nevskiaceae bacterium]TAM31423.1 MAG: Hg(II)-responsive transcriptional regulator [Nevskiaceae bacterium]
MRETYTIGTLAQRADVHLETIRYYQRRGLVGEPDRPLGGVRRYTEDHVQRLRFIRHAQELGFSLDEVGELLKLEDGAHCREARTLGERRLADVRRKLADLQRIESALSVLVDRCGAVKGRVRCPMIASLQAAP